MDPVLTAVEGRTLVDRLLARQAHLEEVNAHFEACWMDLERVLEQALELERRRKARERALGSNGHRVLVAPLNGSG